MEEEIGFKKGDKQTPTLCWCCAKAIGKCSWSSELIPVKGWNACPVRKNTYYGEFSSYVVFECPEFERDAYKDGLKRYRKEDFECDPDGPLGGS